MGPPGPVDLDKDAQAAACTFEERQVMQTHFDQWIARQCKLKLVSGEIQTTVKSYSDIIENARYVLERPGGSF